MNSGPDKKVLELVQSLLAPYARESLSAFDNMKLVIAVISASAKRSNEPQQEAIAYEVTPNMNEQSDNADDTLVQSRQFYCVRWKNLWLDCGLTNDYSASIQLLTHDGQGIKVQEIKVQEIKEAGTSEVRDVHATAEDTLAPLNIETSLLREINVPVLSLQQIEFMCMEYAHFDHC
ncbi:hypothetical protein Sps_02644 [Shewanella psychrophila]|uniref:Uncharacterized protein n=1 Tax=Shewanella psychrophila TaxID=225848 RepID=A0A1S6HQJ0_9GAMM|nr:hypothetical protein [Shewanella psychrophila]AQS37796.1 hypothetical protein Sps_02644 [Shewanella psychrophila]